MPEGSGEIRQAISLDAAGAEIGETLREHVEGVLSQAADIERKAQERAAEIERQAEERAEKAKENEEEARQRASSILEEAREEAERIRRKADDEAVALRRRAVDDAAVAAERAKARLLKHAASVEQELDGLIRGLVRDAKGLGRSE
jgi:colicin import membrane protein